MVIITPFRTSVTLFGRDGSVTVFKSKDAARKQLGMLFLREQVGVNFVERTLYEKSLTGSLALGEPFYRVRPFVLRDSFGEPLDSSDFERPRVHRSYWARRWGSYPGYGPVPGTSKRRGGGSIFRRVRTKQAMTQAQHLDEEPPVRAKRNVANLPTLWDDVVREDCRSSSWKRYRKHQYKS